jgi:phosphatidylserine/phosphatidylglycerophosphate/cardiolipin synthase-like enzyme
VRLLLNEGNLLPCRRSKDVLTALLSAGVLIRAYRPPPLEGIRFRHLHTKAWIGDEWWCAAGSANATWQSLEVNEEAMIFSCDPNLVQPFVSQGETLWAAGRVIGRGELEVASSSFD